MSSMHSIGAPHRAARTRSSRRGSGTLLIFSFLAAAALICSGIYYYFTSSSKEGGPIVLTDVVRRGPFEHIVLEQGEVESSSNVDVICEVKSRNGTGTAILWAIDEGTQVKPGDRLVELDSSALDQELKQQRIIVNNALAAKIAAESLLEQAKIAKLEYIEGIFTQEEKLYLSEILVAEERLSRSRETAKYSERLAALGFQTTLQLKADQFAVDQAKVDLDLAESKLTTLRDITKRKMVVQLDADVETAKAQLDAAVGSYQEEIEKLEEIEEQIEKCVITAPQGGVVVHANKTSSRGGASEFVVEPGGLVRERQVIIRLPDPTKMQVKANINEARIPLIREGLPVSIQIGAFENAVLKGRVTKVNKYAEPTSWFSSQVKEYATFIEILDPPPGVRTGMTAEVRIFVERLSNALQIPVQALYETKGYLFCLVRVGEGRYETREVEISSSNDKMVMIASGLEEGEVVVLNPRMHESKLQLPDLPDAPESEEQEEIQRIVETRPSSPGEPSAGGGAPGGAMTPEAMVAQTLAQYDTDGDGILSAEELAAVPEERREGMMRGDLNGDGQLDRAELLASTRRFLQMMQERQAGVEGGGP
jgi:HlyD family secretion protein